jgi:3-methylcrotonyl-CoA carboxylase alpha subunit
MAASSADPHSPWQRVDGWRLNDVGHQTLRLRAGGEPVAIDARVDGAGWRLHIGGRELRGAAKLAADGRLEVELEGERWRAGVVALGDQLHLFTPRGRFQLQRIDPLAIAASEDELGDVLAAPMPGRIVRQLIAAGDRVARGAPLLVLEAMKMQNEIRCEVSGVVAKLHVRPGQSVEGGDLLFEIGEG